MSSVTPSEASAEGGRATRMHLTQQILRLLVRVPRAWLIPVILAAALSMFTVTRESTGDYAVTFEVTTATILLIGLTWLPAVLAIFVVVGKGLKAFGVEFTGGGLAALFEDFEPAGTVVHAQAQQEPPDTTAVDESEDEFGPGHDSVEVGPHHEWEDEGDVEGLPPESYGTPSDDPHSAELPLWTQDREALYTGNRHIFIAHRIRPSKRPGQLYDISIFLVGARDHRPADVVTTAEFFLGRAWGNKIFEVTNSGAGGTIGMSTAAYGPALCVCRVVFKDGQEALLHRFLDFEMGWAFQAPALEEAA